MLCFTDCRPDRIQFPLIAGRKRPLNRIRCWIGNRTAARHTVVARSDRRFAQLLFFLYQNWIFLHHSQSAPPPFIPWSAHLTLPFFCIRLIAFWQVFYSAFSF